MPQAAPTHHLARFDTRPFFERALSYGVQNGIIDQAKLDAICSEAPKGMVQIARYFGTEFLRPELEKAKDRMVNLVSLHLESTSGGDLGLAAASLRDHSLLSRSKGGSDMLKAMIAMPQNSHFGMHEGAGFTPDHIALLAKWSLRSLPEYQIELAQRREVAQRVDAAIWIASTLGLEVAELEEAGQDADAVIRSGLLALATRRKEMPDWHAFEKMIAALRKKYPLPQGAPLIAAALALPKDSPPELRPVLEGVRQSLLVDLPRVLDATLPARKLFSQTPAFMGRYFWRENMLGEVDHFDHAASITWSKATDGHGDDGSLLTLFLCVATDSPRKTVLTEKTAATLVRKIRKSGFYPEHATQFILDHAPHQHQGDYTNLWSAFVNESCATLRSDRDQALKEAMALLRRECNVGH